VLAILIALFFIGKNLLTENANQVAVPKLTGRTLSDAEAKLRQANLKLGKLTKRTESNLRPGLPLSQSPVLSQTPAPLTKLQEGSNVELTIGVPEPTVAVPDLVTSGMSKAQAKSAITSAGFTLGHVTRSPSNSVPRGQVTSQDPAAGTQAPQGSAVNIVISSGQALVTVPDLTCQPLGQAEAHLQALNLTLVQSGNTQFVSQCPHSGRVASQTPAAGAQVQPGTNVTVDETEDNNTPSPSPSG
jgi:beta-lactam-binding protein with PASTA domain